MAIRKRVNNFYFEMFIIGAICLSSLCLIIKDANWAPQSEGTLIWLERVTLGIFVAEVRCGCA